MRPTFATVGGINGAGKTTLVNQLRRSSDMADALFLNPDQEAFVLRAERPSMTLEAANFRGLRIVLEAVHGALAARRSIVTETVFANHASLQLMIKARSLGFRVRLLFMGVASIEDAVMRVAHRVASGGHAVPEGDIRRRWPLAHDNLARAVGVADEIDVFSNHVIGGTPRLVATARARRVAILDREALPAVTAVLNRFLDS